MIAVGAPARQQLGFVGDQANSKQLGGVSRGSRLRCGFLRTAHRVLALFALTERRGQAQASREATSTRVGVKR